jgi:hypothetical protein
MSNKNKTDNSLSTTITTMATATRLQSGCNIIYDTTEKTRMNENSRKSYNNIINDNNKVFLIFRKSISNNHHSSSNTTSNKNTMVILALVKAVLGNGPANRPLK